MNIIKYAKPQLLAMSKGNNMTNMTNMTNMNNVNNATDTADISGSFKIHKLTSDEMTKRIYRVVMDYKVGEYDMTKVFGDDLGFIFVFMDDTDVYATVTRNLSDQVSTSDMDLNRITKIKTEDISILNFILGNNSDGNPLTAINFMTETYIRIMVL